MKNRKLQIVAFLSALTFFMGSFFGCGQEGDVLYAQRLSEKPAEDSSVQQENKSDASKALTGKITLLEMEISEFTPLWQRAQEFMELHEGVTVQVEQTGLDFNAHNLQLMTRLMSDSCPDIVDLYGSPWRYINSNLFLDLNTLMNADPGFKREDYYTNLLEYYESEGQICDAGIAVT